ncbi:MAG: universal stress protein [Alphaproteobacteria bacterium]
MPGFKSILVPVADADSAESPIATAFLIARSHGCRVTVLHVRVDIVAAMPLVGEGVSGAMVEEMVTLARRDADARAEAVRAVFERLRAEAAPAMADQGFSVAWREESGREEEIVPLLGRVCDLIVMAGPRLNQDLPQVLTVNGALMESGRPVLVAPPARPVGVGRHVVVAWNHSIEAARAVGGTLPLLAAAESVVVVAAQFDHLAEPEELLAYLALHGIHAEVKTMPTTGARFGQILLAEAATRGADLIVMGAYTHSRLRQLIIGGVTRHVLEHSDLPVVLCH